MSMLGGLMGGGGSDFNYSPQATPLTPMRRDMENESRAKKLYTVASGSTYKWASAMGSAASPTKSYTAQLFNTGGGGV